MHPEIPDQIVYKQKLTRQELGVRVMVEIDCQSCAGP